MSVSTSPISLRLPQATREKLDRASALMRRSRSFLMQEALERHLDDIIARDAPHEKKRRLGTLLSLGGVGKREQAPRTAAEVQNYTHWLRGND